MEMTVRVIRDSRQGYDKMRSALSKKADRVLVGITEDVGKQAHSGTGHGSRTMLQVAAWTEFGNGMNSPERSYLRAWFDAHVQESYQMLVSLMQPVFEGDSTKELALETMGKWVEAQVKKNMDAGIPPPNAPYTVKRKGFDKGATETGKLAAAITHVVKKAGEK